MKVRSAVAGLAVGSVCVGLAGCASEPTSSPTTTGASQVTATDAASAAGTDSPADVDPLLDAATQVRDALRDEDYATLATLASEDEKVVFEPYSYVEDESLRLSPQEIVQADTSSQVHTWGAFDGSGEPMVLSLADYRSRFVWDRDYTVAPSVVVDSYQVSGDSLRNIAEYFGPTARWVEYGFPATEVTDDIDLETWDFTHGPPGSDWSALRLVFRESGTDYQLIGIIHDSWTI